MAEQGNLILLQYEFPAHTETPVSAYLKLTNSSSFSFLLESAKFPRSWGRYSLIGCDPHVLVFIYDGGVEVWKGVQKTRVKAPDPLTPLKDMVRETKPVAAINDLPFDGGLVGYLNYDLVRKWERLTGLVPPDPVLPEGVFMAPQRLVVFDHLRHQVRIMALVYLREGMSLKKQYDLACQSIEKTLAELQCPLNPSANEGIEISPFVSNMEKWEFEASVARIREYITAGDVIQVVLSQRFCADISGDVFGIYRRLRDLNHSPYMFFLNFGQTKLIGASPEVLARLTKRNIELCPIAGTRPRGTTVEEDKALEQELLRDTKERAEHVMLVDLGRNDVGKVAVPGSVRVTKFMKVERYSHVMHMVSEVQGMLRPGKDCFDLFRSAFPAGTVTGAPKVRAMEIINELELQPRGSYAGAVGYFAFNGDMDFCITIRTIIITNDMASIQVGAGIVYDSLPEREYEETLRKAEAMFKAIDEAKVR